MEQEFKRNYFRLLKYANTEAGRFLFGIKDKRKIIKLSSNSYHLDNEDGKTRTAAFFTKPYIASIFLPILTKIDLALESKYIQKIIENPYETFLHYSGLETKNWEYPQVYLDSTTFNSNSGGDGGMAKNDSADWATTRNATAAQTADEFPGGGYYGGFVKIGRGFLPFDTSSLGAGATIDTPCTVKLKVSSKSDINDAQSYFTIVQSTQADNTNLVLGDFDQLGTTKGSDDIDCTGIDAGGVNYNTWTLNVTGRGWISVTGWTPLGIREGHDIENVDPTTGLTEINVNFGAGIPQLNVTYLGVGGDTMAYFL